MGRRFVRSILMKPTKVTFFTTNFQFGKQQSRHKNISSSIVLYTSGQTSDSRRHSTCWVSPHGSTLYQHAVPWTQVICSTQPSPVHLLGMHSTSNRDTHLYPLHNSYSSTDNNTAVGRSGGFTDGVRRGWMTLRDSLFSSPTSAPTLMEWPFKGQRVHLITISTPPPKPLFNVWWVASIYIFIQYYYSLFIFFLSQDSEHGCKPTDKSCTHIFAMFKILC